ncbi:MAG: acyl-CoA reductase [Bacteroidales bacterium]|nr:acyl-CoA reductase [Bacteroidales bacterium]
MNLVNRINAFAKLGEVLRNPDPEYFRSLASDIRKLKELVQSSQYDNPWFTPDDVQFALNAIGLSLRVSQLEKWVKKYCTRSLEHRSPKQIGVVMAGNIPLVGFHDYLSVLISGHQLLAKLSSDDKKLLPLLHRILVKIEPGFSKLVTFTEGTIGGFDAIIATGSNNTARYFEFYFEKYPHIIRKNRNSAAVINGNESDEELHGLGEDIFRYFGLGCRNVSKLYVPKNYKFEKLYESLQDFIDVINHHRYKNNYDYNKAVYLINKTPHLDNGFLILKEDSRISSPMSILFYEKYNSLNDLKLLLQSRSNELQAIVSAGKPNFYKNSVSPGKTQFPELSDYADGVDTLQFLSALK